MQIVVNGKPMEVEDGITVDGLLTLLNVKREYTAVAVNREVTPKSTYASIGRSRKATRSRLSGRWVAVRAERRRAAKRASKRGG